MSEIKATLLANEGVILQYAGSKMMIDGIQDGGGSPFSGMSGELFRRLSAGEEPLFRDIDFVLYTHDHPDHFTASLNEEFFGQNTVDALVIPRDIASRRPSFADVAGRGAARLFLLDSPKWETTEIRLNGNISLKAFLSAHAGKGEIFENTVHYCYLIRFGERKVFIIGDSDYDADYFENMLDGEDIDAAFVNPLFLTFPAGREVIERALKPKRVIAYHIPFEKDDSRGYRSRLALDLERRGKEMPPVDALWDELQEITI
ncbi:MAG: hypothetical protein LBQ19_00960 [Synergistaceae bacterium]|jgi:L-ascorbate metabolism protein UlaG (beta-lactamase superfamily)|nr:hypothetical protein [Synergistaceae bacterium]